MKTLIELINEVSDSYQIGINIRKMALDLDPRALKQIGDIVGNRQANLTPSDIYEVCKWGISWRSSRYPELQNI